MNYSIQILIIFYIYLLFLGLLGVKIKPNSRKYLLFVQILSVSIFFGLRNLGIGVDTINYYVVYINQYNWLDFGLTIINRIIYVFFGENYRIYLLIISFLTALNLGFFYYFIMNKDNKYLNFAYSSMFVFPYTILMFINVVRQGLAISFILLGMIVFIKLKRNTILGFFLLIFGSLIHYSMIIPTFVFLLFLIFKVEHKTILISSFILVIFSYTELTQTILLNFPVQILRYRFLAVSSFEIGIGIVARYIFYVLIYLLAIYISKKINSNVNSLTSKIIGIFVFVSSMVFFSDLVSSRYLIAIDFLIPFGYFNFISITKEKKMSSLIYLSIFIFIATLSFSSYSLRLNFDI